MLYKLIVYIINGHKCAGGADGGAVGDGAGGDDRGRSGVFGADLFEFADEGFFVNLLREAG